MTIDPSEPREPQYSDPIANPGDGAESDIPIDPDSIARLIDEHAALVAERDRLLRAAADLQNQLNRVRRDLPEARRQGVTGVCRDVILALDHFDMALAQDLAGASIESVLGGMRAIRAELIRAMTAHGVAVIDPPVGEPFNPERHEAVARRAAPEQPEGLILAVFQIGYALEDRVIRPAKVVVSAAP